MTTRKLVELAEAREEREREKRDKRFDEQLQVINTINAIFTGNLWIEKREKRGYDELHTALEKIIARKVFGQFSCSRDLFRVWYAR